MQNNNNNTRQGSPPLEAGNLATVEEIKEYLVLLGKERARERKATEKKISDALEVIEKTQRRVDRFIEWAQNSASVLGNQCEKMTGIKAEVQKQKDALAGLLEKDALTVEEYNEALQKIDAAVDRIEEENKRRIEDAMQEALQSIEAERAKTKAAEKKVQYLNKSLSEAGEGWTASEIARAEAEKKHAPFEATQGKGGKGVSLTSKQIRQIIEKHLKENKTPQEIADALEVEARQVKRVLTVDYKGQPAKRAILSVVNQLLKENQNPKYISKLNIIKEKCLNIEEKKGA
jgi:hypothetical protein